MLSPLFGGDCYPSESGRETFGDFQLKELVTAFSRAPARSTRGSETGSFSCPINIVIYWFPLVPTRSPFAQGRYCPMNAKKSYWKILESKKVAIRTNF